MSTKKITTNRSRIKEFKLIAGVMAVSGLIIAALALLTPQVVGTINDGTEVITITAFTPLNMIVALIGSFMFAGGNAYILFKEDVEIQVEYRTKEGSVPPTSAPPLPLPRALADNKEGTAQYVEQGEDMDHAAESPSAQEVTMGKVAESQEGHLVLRLLSGDERTVFQVIMDAGGEIYQKEIVNNTDMSNAKVSRVLDRLAEKGVITKERQGMSNKVRIELDR